MVIHGAAGLLILSLTCLALFGVYPLISGERIDTFALTGSVVAVVTSGALVAGVVRWRL